MKGRILATASAVSLIITFACSSALAHPSENSKQQGPKHGAHQYQTPKHGVHQHRSSKSKEQQRVTVDESVVRAIFRSEPTLLAQQPDLPPGIRKNLARGKPLPPGLAKRFDSRIDARLPQYSGYEWRQIGRDAVLVTVTTGIVEAVLNNIFD